jgi:translation initiation factor 2 subunit 2
MPDYDYKKLLKRAQGDAHTVKADKGRFVVPKVDIFYEGRTTVLRNFDKILDTINRDADHLLKFLLRELGTAGEKEGNRVMFQGKVQPRQIQERINAYIDMYVMCQECNRPDTHLVKEGRTILLRCDACGAFRPIKSQRKRTLQKPTETIEEGKIYEFTIKDIGKKGDGVAYFGKYIIYVADAVKGSTIKVKIDKVSGTIAFGKKA